MKQFKDSLDKRTHWIYVSTEKDDGTYYSYVLGNLTSDDLFDPFLNRHIANSYLNWLSNQCDPEVKRFQIDEILIAWNWGIGNLKKWKKAHCLYGIKGVTDCRDLLPKETSDFLKKYHKLVDSI